MFNLLFEEPVAAAPRRDAFYVSLTIHFCTLLALMWLAPFGSHALRLEVITTHAGTPEPVREPQLIYAPVRSLRTSHSSPKSGPGAPSRTDIPSAHQSDEGNHVEYAPTAIPSDLLALFETDTGFESGLGPTLAGMRPIHPSTAVGDVYAPSPTLMPAPPEPPPGELDVQPPPVIGGRVEQAVLIEQTKPIYPPLARTARVEGVVVLEGTVNVHGRVENLKMISGHPLLVDAAISAVKKWKYRPAKLNGQVIPCPVSVQVRFVLQYSGG
jgi:TonB family protein